MTIYAMLDAQGAVIDWQDLRGSSEPGANMRPATADEIAALASGAPKTPPSPRVWLERLSGVKQAAISAAALAHPEILLWVLKAAGEGVIDVAAAETLSGVAALVSAGIITTDDQAILLAP